MNQRSGAPVPYDVGQELVAFLASPGSDAFYIANDNPAMVVPIGSYDPATVFLVQDSRIQRAPPEFSRYVGMPIDSFLGELRALSRSQVTTQVGASRGVCFLKIQSVRRATNRGLIYPDDSRW